MGDNLLYIQGINEGRKASNALLEKHKDRITELEGKYSRLHDAYEASELDVKTFKAQLEAVKKVQIQKGTLVRHFSDRVSEDFGDWMRAADILKAIGEGDE